jgi:Protein of unknown function (DUF3795)
MAAMENNLEHLGQRIAPCGMNCGICIAYLREKKPCGGCFKNLDENKPKHCRSCSIVNCELLAEIESGFCFDCEKYPCLRLKSLDKRYRTKYGMSMLDNLESIKNYGLDKFIQLEKERWICETCGSELCVHRDFCLNCHTSRKKQTYPNKNHLKTWSDT